MTWGYSIDFRNRAFIRLILRLTRMAVLWAVVYVGPLLLILGALIDLTI